MTARPTRAVIVTIGATDGLAWELDRLARAGHVRKTTFLVPPVPDADTWARWAFTSGELVRSGNPVAPATLAAAPSSSAITIQLDGNGACVVHAAGRRDEATYRSALHEAASARGIDARRMVGRLPPDPGRRSVRPTRARAGTAVPPASDRSGARDSELVVTNRAGWRTGTAAELKRRGARTDAIATRGCSAEAAPLRHAG